jgi:hypothetical protein
MAYGRFDVPKEFLTLTADQVEEYSAAARVHYRADYPYHNWNHALVVASGTEIIARKLERKGQTIATGALAVAAAWHDAGYHENHLAKGFTTKEEYSAALLDEFLEHKHVSDWERSMMSKVIIATWSQYDGPRTPYELILHRSDVANIGGPRDEFIQNSLLLREESLHIVGKIALWDDYVKGAGVFIEFTADEHDDESLFHFIDPLDTTLDVNDLPFKQTALANLEALRDFEAQ